MRFERESAFREWICGKLETLRPEPWIVLKEKNVADILLARQDPKKPLLLFLEVKYHKVIHGRIPIGSGSGSGYQPEYLMRKVCYLESHLRWMSGAKHHLRASSSPTMKYDNSPLAASQPASTTT